MTGKQELVSDIKLISMCVGNSGKMHVPGSSSALSSHVTTEGTRKSSQDLIHWEVSGSQHDLGQNNSTTTSGQIHSAGSCWVQLWPSAGLREKSLYRPSPDPHREEQAD